MRFLKFAQNLPENDIHVKQESIPKNGGIDFCFTRISFSGEFWANFENRVF